MTHTDPIVYARNVRTPLGVEPYREPDPMLADPWQPRPLPEPSVNLTESATVVTLPAVQAWTLLAERMATAPSGAIVGTEMPLPSNYALAESLARSAIAAGLRVEYRDLAEIHLAGDRSQWLTLADNLDTDY